jgi:hypothetical protein
MARVTVQNQLQTLEDQIAFIKAIHEEERNQLLDLGALPFDNRQFYRTQLTGTINAIKNDYEKLAEEQKQEWTGLSH